MYLSPSVQVFLDSQVSLRTTEGKQYHSQWGEEGTGHKVVAFLDNKDQNLAPQYENPATLHWGPLPCWAPG